ncbi:MAG: DUF512 domain-containing protein [Christensenellaceae bacterium]|jgi:putative radical SAM enzyme (TIGR03279 family)
MLGPVKSVRENSIASECGIKVGDRLLSVNGQPATDYIDYEYHMADTSLLLVFETADREKYEAEIEKEPYEDLGVEFADDGFGKKIVCKNKCVFCFVDQMPLGMRKTLYFKDDDWRMSFLMGSYITLTNLSSGEIDRIIQKKISPLYISVHATDDNVRALLLGTPRAAETMSIMRRLAENGIHMHTQIVLCEGINDREVLQKSIRDLSALFPAVQSLAIVPAGLTRHREGLYELQPLTQETARNSISMLEQFQSEFLRESGTLFVFGADELYIKAGLPLPEYDTYEDFPQIENGVGLIAKFMQEAEEGLEDIAAAADKSIAYGIVTGEDMAPFLKKLADRIKKRHNVEVTVFGVENRFFGQSVTVTGLLTAQDIVAQLKGRLRGVDILLLSGTCFREHTDTTLDDWALADIEKALRIKCEIIPPDGFALVERLMG